MSLDVSLIAKEPVKRQGKGIFIREGGRTRELSFHEISKYFPGTYQENREESETKTVYKDNITHNLGKMARMAGIYLCLWRPEELGIDTASFLIEGLERGLKKLKSNPDYFKSFNPKNGWGDYDGLVAFVENYLDACKKFPDAKIEVDR